MQTFGSSENRVGIENAMEKEVFIFTKAVILKQLLSITCRKIFCLPVYEAENCCPFIDQTVLFFFFCNTAKDGTGGHIGVASLRLYTGAILQITPLYRSS